METFVDKCVVLSPEILAFLIIFQNSGMNGFQQLVIHFFVTGIPIAQTITQGETISRILKVWILVLDRSQKPYEIAFAFAGKTHLVCHFVTRSRRGIIHRHQIIHLCFIGKRIQIAAKTHIRQRQTKKRFLDAGIRVFKENVLTGKCFIPIQIHLENLFVRVGENHFQAVVFGDLGLNFVGFGN